jgi:hypothetical protein
MVVTGECCREYDVAAAEFGRESMQTAAVGVRFLDMCNAVAVQYMSNSSSSSGGGGGKHLQSAQRVLHRAQVSIHSSSSSCPPPPPILILSISRYCPSCARTPALSTPV